MDKGLLDFLDEQRSKPIQIDRLIISLFLFSNAIFYVKNTLVESYIIRETDEDYNLFESLKKKHERNFL